MPAPPASLKESGYPQKTAPPASLSSVAWPSDNTSTGTAAAERVLDEADDFACGFCSLQILDHDGHPKRGKNVGAEGPWHFKLLPNGSPSHRSPGGSVRFEARFAPNPLFSTMIKPEADEYLMAWWWIGGDKHGRSNHLCALTPQSCKEMMNEASSSIASPDRHGEDMVEVEAEAEVAALPGGCVNGTRCARVWFTLGLQRSHVARISAVVVEMPLVWWREFKAYRLKLWHIQKAWPLETLKSAPGEGTSGCPGGSSNGYASGAEFGDARATSTAYYASEGPPDPCIIL